MQPPLLALIESIRWTFAEKIAPALDDPLAASYARTLLHLLDEVQRRVEHGPRVLAEDVRDVRALLGQVAGDVSDDLRARIAAALAADGGEREVPRGITDLEAESAVLRGILAAAIKELPTEKRNPIRAYLARQLARESACHPPVSSAAF